MADFPRWPSCEYEADACALEALASFPGTGLCWSYNAKLDAFREPLNGPRVVPADRVEALRATTDPEVQVGEDAEHA